MKLALHSSDGTENNAYRTVTIFGTEKGKPKKKHGKVAASLPRLEQSADEAPADERAEARSVYEKRERRLRQLEGGTRRVLRSVFTSNGNGGTHVCLAQASDAGDAGDRNTTRRLSMPREKDGSFARPLRGGVGEDRFVGRLPLIPSDIAERFEEMLYMETVEDTADRILAELGLEL